MRANDLASEAQLSRSYGGHGNDLLKKELLAFWSRHPNGRFLASTISCALDHRKIEVKRALEELVKGGLIDTYIQNGLTLYSFTKDENKRELLLLSFASDRNKQRPGNSSLE